MLVKLISVEEFNKISPNLTVWYFDKRFSDTRKKLSFSNNIYNVKKYDKDNYQISYKYLTNLKTTIFNDCSYLIEKKHCIIVDKDICKNVFEKYEERLKKCESELNNLSEKSKKAELFFDIVFAKQKLEFAKKEFKELGGLTFYMRANLTKYYKKMDKIIKILNIINKKEN
jgi:hypothetical protein